MHRLMNGWIRESPESGSKAPGITLSIRACPRCMAWNRSSPRRMAMGLGSAISVPGVQAGDDPGGAVSAQAPEAHRLAGHHLLQDHPPPFIQTPAAEMSQGPGHHRLPPPFAGGSESYLPSPGKETARSSRGMMAKGHGSTTRAAGIPRSRENPATGAVRSLPARVWPSARFWTAANRNVTTKAQRYPIEFTGNSLYFCGVFFCLSAGTARTGARESRTAAPVAGFSRERSISWIVSGREFFGYPLTHSLASVRAAYGHDQAPCSRSRTPSPD